MLYHLAHRLKLYIHALNVVHYVSFRAIVALLTSLTFSLIWGNRFIEHSKRFFRSKAREHAPAHHQQKDDMPTMGGLFIIGVVVISSLLWCNLADPKVWIMLLCLCSFGVIGFWDDWRKVKKTRGISARFKFYAQLGVAALVSLLLVFTGFSTEIYVPFFKNFTIHSGPFFVAWVAFVLIAMSNAVNLTDGLDGLAIGSLIPNFGTFSLICYLAGNAMIAHYLQIPFAASAEITVMGAILVGASLGFLWYNTYPAQIFMGDVGSLALGAALGLMALMSKQELLLPIAGGLFVVEVLSVIIQVFSFKYLGRRMFKMAPLHHHFELHGWPESKITARFGIISLVLCLVALITLKIR